MADLNFAGPVVGQKNIAEPLNLRKDFFTASGPSWNINEDKEENLIESVSVSNEPLHIQDKTAQAIQKPAALQDKVSARVAEVEAAGTAQQMADFAVPVTSEQWRMISTAASQSDNPDEELQRYAAALTYGREYGVDTETALQNLNEFTMHQLGKPYSPTTTGVQAIANSFKVGKLNMRFNDLAYQLKQADLKGEDISGYLTELDSMATEIASLQDYQPRNIVTTALKWTMEGAVPYMIEVGKASLIGATAAGAMGTAFTAATGVVLGSLAAATPWTMAGIIAIGATVGAINRTRELEEGATYLNLRQMGVDKDIANVLSRTNAMVVGAIEAGLGIEAGTILKAVGGDTLASQVTSAVVAKLNTSGALGALANAAVSSTVGAGGEFIQEFTQEISDITHTYIAHAWQSMRTDMEPLPDESALKQALYAGYRGFVSAIVLGAASSVVNTSFDLRQQAKMKENAKANPSKEAFIASLKDSKPESVTGADWSEATSGIWEKAHKDQKQSTSIQSEEAAVNELDYGAGEKAKGSVRRLSTGELYTKEDGTPTTDTSGAEHHRLLVGDPATGARYGHIEYAISDNTLTINDVRVKSGYENIRQESILSLAKQYPGYDIQWEAKGENLQSIKDSIIESNPRGKDAGLQYFDGVTNVDERIKLEGQIKDAMPNLNASERALGATMIQLTAESQGKTTEAYLQASFRDGKLFGDTREMDSAMQGKKGAVSFTNDLKAVIYAGEKADFSTFTHETFHVAMRNMGQTEQFRTAVTEASQTPEFITWLDDHAELFKDSVFDGKDAKGLAELAADFGSENWGRSHEEFAARLFEGYLADGKTASPKLQGLFKRIAEWMGRIYTTLKHNVALDPRIVEAFDSMLDADTPLSQAARESQDQERTSTQSKDTAQNLYQETDGQRQYDAVVSEYRGTEQWMKAPNGKDTNLNERQWVQVRTPAFLEWFGDWINDPENASKVVDENGEPKVMYHGSRIDNIEIFDDGGRGIIYTTHDVDFAKEFMISNETDRTYELFVNLRNPADPVNDSTALDIIADVNSEDSDLVLESFEYGDEPFLLIEHPDVISKLIEAGYDGVMFDESGQISHGVFSPNQIKSATGNNGDFSTNPNVLYQEAPPVGSAEFKSLFANTKVVDNQGTPLVMYHGTDIENIRVFDTSDKTLDFTIPHGRGDNIGTFFTAVENDAKDFGGNVVKAYLNLENPMIFNTQDDFRVFMREHSGQTPDIRDSEGYIVKEGVFDNLMREKIESQGYDGVIIEDPSYSREPGIWAVAFDPTQIKSVNNRGTWDKTNPNILFQEDGKPVIETDFPKRPDINIFEFEGSREEYYRIIDNWKKELKEWVGDSSDLLQFGDEDLVHVVHKNVIPGENPWRSTSFLNRNGEWTPLGHRDYDTKYEAVYKEMDLKDYRPDILFQESNEKRPLEKRVSNDYLLDVKDMIDEIIEVGGKVSDLGIITVYHATSKNSAEKIKKTGRMIAKEDGLFFSTKSDGQITGYGESVVKFEIPAELLIIDDIFEDEAHLVLELGNSRSKNIGMYDPSILFQEDYQVPDGYTMLYNGGQKQIDVVRDTSKESWSLYDGLFAGYSQAIAEAHGNTISRFLIADDKIANSNDLDTDYYDGFIKRELGIDKRNKNFYGIYESIVEDKHDAEAWEPLRSKLKFDDDGGWYAQKLRGRLAKELGFEAVEMDDEHGTSYYIVPGIRSFESQILFQEENREAITEQILEDAKGFETWEGMKYYYESLYGTDMWGDALDEAYQSDEWYQAVFNEANGISETAAKAVDPQMSPEARLADEKQKDGYIKEKLSTDEGIKAFMEKLGWVLNVGFDRSSPSMEDRQMAETVQNLRETLPEMVHPTILSNAKRVGGGKTLTERAIKSIRTLMTGDGIRYYRDIYADVMEDPQLKPQVIDERLPSIESPGYNLTGFSITDRIKLADSIEAAPLKKAILSGKETLEGSAEKVIKVMDREIDDSNKQIEKLEQELKDMEDKLSESEMWHFHYAKQYSEASRSLDAEMKQIRKLTNDNMQVPEAQMKSATRLQAKVDLLHDQMMKNRASERVNATVKRHEALAELKEKLKEKQKTKDDAKKVRAYKLKLARKIMVKPSDAINYDQAQLIYNIQATLDPVFRQKSMELEIDGEQQRVTIDEAREALEGVSDEELQMAMGKRLYERIIGERKPLNDWTVAELEETLETVADLRSEGRAILAAKQEQKQIIAQNYQDAIIRSLMATGKYTSQPLVGTKQDQKEKNHPINVARAFRYGTLAMRPKAMMLDNNTQGAAYKLLVTMKRAAQNAEWRAVERRMEPVFKVMKEYGITEKDLYQTVQISLGERMEEYTYSHLMYAWLSQHDQANRNAVAYGNLISKDEKIALDHDNDLIRELGDSRYRQLMDQVQYHLETQDESGGYMAVVKAVQEDFNAQAPRLNEVAIREFNKAMRVVEQYLPIHRKEFSGADMRQQVAEDLFNAKAGSNATGVAKGFQKDRIFISPDHQTPVNLDLMGVWNKSARQQEHFIAFAEYGRTLNRVFKNLGSRDLENAINRTLGKEMYQDVTEYINQIINPQPNNNLKGLEKGVKFIRGNLGAAYLTWKMGGLVLQAITSPMPYLSVIRADKLVKAYIGIFAHPIKSIEFINSKSAMMKNRTMNVIIDQILQESRTYTDNRLVRWNRKQQEIGSMGLTLVDRYAVAGGWLAAYEQKLNDLQSQGLVFADADAQAVIYADDIVLKTQPTGDATEIAPLFVTGSEFARAFIQFKTSLNPIWANLTYDMPQAFKKAAGSSLPDAVRKQQFSQAIGTIVGYALAGALLGAVAEGHDEDDDAIDKLRNWIYWSFTQATASVPLVGDVVDNLVESAVTGDKPHVFSDEFFPGISKLFKGAVYLTQGDIEKGLKNLAEGGGYMTGLPVSGYKQLKKAITEDPGALLGR